jgi:hypothetical protein
MSRTNLVLLCALAFGGTGLAVRSTLRVRTLEAELASTASAGQAAGHSFVETLRGEHAERQRLAFDRRREVALALASARRDRMLGALAVVAAGLGLAARRVMGRIAAEIAEDRRHVAQGTPERGPNRS